MSTLTSAILDGCCKNYARDPDWPALGRRAVTGISRSVVATPPPGLEAKRRRRRRPGGGAKYGLSLCSPERALRSGLRYRVQTHARAPIVAIDSYHVHLSVREPKYAEICTRARCNLELTRSTHGKFSAPRYTTPQKTPSYI